MHTEAPLSVSFDFYLVDNQTSIVFHILCLCGIVCVLMSAALEWLFLVFQDQPWAPSCLLWKVVTLSFSFLKAGHYLHYCSMNETDVLALYWVIPSLVAHHQPHTTHTHITHPSYTNITHMHHMVPVVIVFGHFLKHICCSFLCLSFCHCPCHWLDSGASDPFTTGRYCVCVCM